MTTLRTATWRIIRKRPGVLLWMLWLPVEDFVKRIFGANGEGTHHG